MTSAETRPADEPRKRPSGRKTTASFEHRGFKKALRQVLAPRYDLGAEVGRGGMACVYRATDHRHGRSVAVKVLHPALAGGVGAERFLREIELVSRLTHPHIVPFIDSGADSNLLYYIMPFLDETLADRIERAGRLDVAEALRITDEIADALEHAHSGGLIHRDIKPSNIMLAAGHAMVSDFGLARVIAMAGDLTPSDVNVGTPLYMSPEQSHRSRDVDARSDQYSLACVTFEMLAGRPPFQGVQEVVQYQHTGGEPPPLSTLRPDAPFAITHALQRALAKSPSDRFDSVAAFARALHGPSAASAAITDGGAVPNNLPRLNTSFVGRENELWECARLLDGHRLVTLTGMGGAGKTRLALRLTERRLHAYAGGAWLVELASVVDPQRVEQAVAAAIGVRERADRPLAELVEERLGSERTLLVLDNCEHLRDATASIAHRLLEACGGLVILATSREPLSLGGERVFRVPPMGVPPAGAGSDIGAIANAEAVRLFVARAASTPEGFVLGEANAGAVADICRQLDGIPLAIELVAARARMISLEEIRRLLGDRFRLVSGTGATTSERHRALRATIDWSYELLDPEERRMFRALAVFRGGWTLSAAAAVCTAGDSYTALDGMTRLAEKSLMSAERDDEQEARHRMLETVRLYALERLETEGEAGALRTVHLEYYRSLAEAGDRAIWTGEDQTRWLDRLERDHENLLAALEWAREDAARARRGLELAAFLYRFWYTRGHYETARVALDRALDAPGAHAPDLARAQALFVAGGIAVFQGRYPDAKTLYGQSLAIWRTLDTPRGIARALIGLALVNAAEGRYREARAANEESLAIYRGQDDSHSVQIVLHNQGDVALCEEAWEEARQLYEQSLAVAGDDRTVPAQTLSRLALVAIRQGDSGEALRPLARALRHAIDLKATDSGVEALEAAAELAAGSGDLERAVRVFGCADAVRQRAGLRQEPGLGVQREAVIARLRTALGLEAFARAWAGDQDASLDTACTTALDGLGGAGMRPAEQSPNGPISGKA